MRTLARTALAGLAFYVLAAACSAAADVASNGPDSGPAALIDAMVDGVTSPVPDAKAQQTPTGPTYSDEACDKLVGPILGATHSYPGKSAKDLYLVHAVCHLTKPLVGEDAGDSWSIRTSDVYVRDEMVAVPCNTTCSSITFVLP